MHRFYHSRRAVICFSAILAAQPLPYTNHPPPAGDGGVIKTILAEGKGWANPGKDDVITLELKATSLEGTDTVYTSPEGGYQVTLASGGADAPFFCRALEVALPKMKKGERATLVVKPQYGPVQGPGAGEALEIEVTLVDWQKVERLPGGVVKRTLVSTDEWQTPNEGGALRWALQGG